MNMITRKHLKTSVGDVQEIHVKRGELDVTLINYGAAIYSVKMNGKELTVRPDGMEDFLHAKFYYGKTIGRTGGRLIAPSYTINGISYPVKPYRGETTKLHGGPTGFSFRHFDVIKAVDEKHQSMISMKYVSADGEEDYPGELTLFVHYTITDDNRVRIAYEATSTKDTLCSITNHIYLNLDGEGTINEHFMKVEASKYVALDENLVPVGQATVEKTPYDLRRIGSITGKLKALSQTPIGGFDHTWLFDKNPGRAIIQNSHRNLQVELKTNYPAVVIFAHNVPSLDVLPERFGNGVRSALTLECEYEPGGIHFPGMNTAILKKGEKYDHYMELAFSTLD